MVKLTLACLFLLAVSLPRLLLTKWLDERNELDGLRVRGSEMYTATLQVWGRYGASLRHDHCVSRVG